MRQERGASVEYLRRLKRNTKYNFIAAGKKLFGYVKRMGGEK